MTDGYDETTNAAEPEAGAEESPNSELQEPDVAPGGDSEGYAPDAAVDDMTGVLEASVVASSPIEAGFGQPAPALTKKEYARALVALQPEFAALQLSVRQRRLKVALLLEGRDAGRKASVAYRIAEALDARVCRVVSVSAPEGRERRLWPFQRFVAELPAEGEVVICDGTWYGWAAVDFLKGMRNDEALAGLLAHASALERLLGDSGFTIVKCWLADGEEGGGPERELRSLARRWSVPARELDGCTRAGLTSLRNAIVDATSTVTSPWHVVFCDDRREARLDAIRHLLERVAVASMPSEEEP